MVGERIGSDQTCTTSGEGAYGGVVFGYDDSVVHVWAPVSTGNANSPNGYAIKTDSGWGAESSVQASTVVKVRVQAETLRPADYDSGWLPMDQDTPYREVDHGMDDALLTGQVRVVTRSTPSADALSGVAFDAIGSMQANALYSCDYGGVIYGYGNTSVHVWAPSPYDSINLTPPNQIVPNSAFGQSSPQFEATVGFDSISVNMRGNGWMGLDIGEFEVVENSLLRFRFKAAATCEVEPAGLPPGRPETS